MPHFPTWIMVLYFVVKGDGTFHLNTGLEGTLVFELQINMQPVLLKSMGVVKELWQDQHRGRATTGLRQWYSSLSQHSKKSLLQPCWGIKGRGSDDPSGIWLFVAIWTVWAPLKRRTCLRGTCSRGVRWWWNALKLFGKFSLYKVSFTQQTESVADQGSATCWQAMLDAGWLHLQAQAVSHQCCIWRDTWDSLLKGDNQMLAMIWAFQSPSSKYSCCCKLLAMCYTEVLLRRKIIFIKFIRPYSIVHEQVKGQKYLHERINVFSLGEKQAWSLFHCLCKNEICNKFTAK